MSFPFPPSSSSLLYPSAFCRWTLPLSLGPTLHGTPALGHREGLGWLSSFALGLSFVGLVRSSFVVGLEASLLDSVLRRWALHIVVSLRWIARAPGWSALGLWGSVCWRRVVLAIVVGVLVAVAIASVVVSVLVRVGDRYPAFAAIVAVRIVARCTGVILRSLLWAMLDSDGQSSSSVVVSRR